MHYTFNNLMRIGASAAIFLLCSSYSYAQKAHKDAKAVSDSLKTDTVFNLKEVTVSGARIIQKVDRQVILPTQTIVKHSTNGYDLLKKLMIPTISVDEVQHAITSSAGSVQIRINDVKANQSDILALQPDEVVRVEFIDNPGVRYNEDGLAAVINYIVKRRYAGYVGGLSTTQAFTTGFNNSNAYFKYNHKKSEFSLSYNFSYRDYDKQHTDQYATYLQPNGIERNINYLGFNNTMAYNAHTLQLGYNLASPDQYVLNVRFDFGWMNAPYSGGIMRVEETGKADLLQYNRNANHDRTPSLDLYYSVNLPHKQTLAVDVVGTYIGTNYSHRQLEYLFDETLDKTIAGKALHDYSYKTDGKKYSLISEAIYTKTFSKLAAFSSGFNYTVSRTDNKYTGSNNVNTILNTNNVYGFAQLQGQAGIFNYQLGVGANYVSIEQSVDGFHKWTFRPQIMLSANPLKNVNIRYTGRLRTNNPSLAWLSEVRQQSSTLQAYDGNAALTSYNIYSNDIRVTWNTPKFSLYSQGGFQHMPDPIMMSILPQKQDDGSYLYIWKPENQKKFEDWTWNTSLTWHAIKNVLDLMVSCNYEKDKSRGLTYSHDYDFWGYQFYGDLTLGKWNISYWFRNSFKSLWGEDITGGENGSNLEITYRHKNVQVGLGCLLLGYAQGYNYTNETNSRYYRSTSSTRIKDNGNMLFFSFAYNFSHGRKYNAGNRIIENSDHDSGIR